MAPRKLSDSDKQQITAIYCQSGETTSTLAAKFGVSSSTVSRVLKQILSDDHYAELMKWKRSGERGKLSFSVESIIANPAASAALSSGPEATSTSADDTAAPNSELTGEKEQSTATEVASEGEQKRSTKPIRRSRKRSTAADTESDGSDVATAEEDATELAPATKSSADVIETIDVDAASQSYQDAVESEESATSDPSELSAWVADEIENSSDDYDDDDEADEDWDEDEWEEDADEEGTVAPQKSRQEALSVLSFSDFTLQKPCYLVVDRMSELITCPLKDFGELGVIPAEEEQARTLPVFDNHRVARRFARRNQRIIKVPNGLMLNKTQGYLQAKGISRVLFDGQVYALH